MGDSGVGTSNENSDNSVFDVCQGMEFCLPAIPLPAPGSQALPELMEACSQHDFVGKIPNPKIKTKKRFGSYLTNSKQRNLRIAASTNNIELAEKLLQSGVDPNSSDEYRRSPLHLASCKGYNEMVKLLIKHGANPNNKDNLGNTPLHLAACTSHIPVVIELLDAGTDVTSNNQNGRTPVQLAQSKLKLYQLRPSSTSNSDETRKILDEIFLIVEMMLKYLKIQKEDSSLLESLRARLENVSTKEEIDTEVQSLLDNLNTLQLK